MFSKDLYSSQVKPGLVWVLSVKHWCPRTCSNVSCCCHISSNNIGQSVGWLVGWSIFNQMNQMNWFSYLKAFADKNFKCDQNDGMSQPCSIITIPDFYNAGVSLLKTCVIKKTFPQCFRHFQRQSLTQEVYDGSGSLTWVIFPTIEFYIFVPLVSTCDPQGGASFDSKGILWIRLIKVNIEILNTKYQSSNPFSFREEEFWSWFS